ncbi:MAG: response regulator [Myxococcales bacterium]|nr:response regulator [Myxococcales bacterium]
MTQPGKPVILGIDEDRATQAAIARAFNEAGVFYRFITDRKKLHGGLSQLKPDLLLVFGELSSDFSIHVLDTLAQDVTWAARPVMVVCRDTADAPFVSGLRTGVVALLAAPFEPQHVAVVKAVWDELPSRPGSVSGGGDPKTLGRLIDHIRRTRRTGVLATDPRTPNEGRATFTLGKLERARFLAAHAQDALKAMLSQPRTQWSFSEMAGSHGEGAGVVIEVGEITTGETELTGVVVVGQEVEQPPDEPLAFEVPVTLSPAPQPAPPAAPPSDQGPARLLLVDDDAAILQMFSRLFTKHGFEVATAADGQLGVEAALSRDFDVVLADLNMPHLDGWGMLRALRDDFRTRELPIAFISAHDDYRESLRALDAGAQAYLSKGVKLDAIVCQTRKLLEPRNQVLAQLEIGQPFPLPLHAVGPQWFLRQLAQRHLGGTLMARDGWASYQLYFSPDGTCLHASATAGKFTAEGERALNAFIASKAAEGDFLPGPIPAVVKNLFLSTEVMIERAASTLNENERRMREGLMLAATQIDVNAALYAVYQQVGPKGWLETARLICEEKLPPREVIAHIDISPIEVEETMKDLIRRGVVTLKRA